MSVEDAIMNDDVGQALMLLSTAVDSWNNLHNKALCLEMSQRYEEAKAVYRAASVATKNTMQAAQSIVGLANCHRHQGDHRKNVEVLKEAELVDSAYPQTYFLLSAHHLRGNEIELSVKALFNGYQKAMDCDAEDVDNFLQAYTAAESPVTNTFIPKIYRKGAASLLDLLYSETDQALHYMLLHKLATLNGARSCLTPPASSRLWCFVSEHFRQGSIASNFMPLLQALLQQGDHEIHLWSVGRWEEDDMTAVFEKLPGVTFWRARPTVGMAVAICLDGHTGSGEALRNMASERLAPLQLDYLGYPFTTGSPAIDGKIVDSHTDPPGQDDFFTEELIRLPNSRCMWTWDSWARCEVGSPRPGTILVCQNFKKVRPSFLRCCDRILTNAPAATMHFRCTLRADAQTVFETWVLPHFSHHNRSRVEHVQSPPHNMLQRELGTYHISLDTWPYNGTVTTIECLAAGLPVVTHQQAMHRGRTSSSMLDQCGLRDLITFSEDHFCDVALLLLQHSPIDQHQEVMDNFHKSSIVDAKGMASAFSAAVDGFKTVR